MLSPASHTEDSQTNVAAGPVHAPFRVGLVCGASFGILVPFVSLTPQVWLVSLHQRPAVQSPSTLQPSLGWHKKFVLQAPERQTVVSFASEHGP